MNTWSEGSALNGGPYRGLSLPPPEQLSQLMRQRVLQLYGQHITADGKVGGLLTARWVVC